MLKMAEVVPVHKNDNPLNEMPCFSEVFEALTVDQLNRSLSHAFSNHLSGFRKGHSRKLVANCTRNVDSSNAHRPVVPIASQQAPGIQPEQGSMLIYYERFPETDGESV